MRKLHLGMAETHYDIERRHLAAARMHTAHADRLAAWNASGSPRFMAAVAATVGASHVGLSLVADDRIEVLTAASDPVASAAQDLEFTIGEGPVHDVTTVGDVIVVGVSEVFSRWPQYAPAVAALGVQAVAAAPLRTPTACLGALTVFDPSVAPEPTALRTVADALVHTALLTPDSADPLDVPLLADAVERAVVHQASGMLAVQLGCRAADGLAVLRARAFVEDRSVTDTARDVVRKRLRLS